jgi:hypothetical protein
MYLSPLFILDTLPVWSQQVEAARTVREEERKEVTELLPYRHGVGYTFTSGGTTDKIAFD